MSSRVHCRIQHHPSRAHLIEPLLALLGDAEVVTDPDPDNRYRSPWRTYRRCLEAPPAGVTHVLVLQDDTLPCRDLQAVCERVARPEPLCLFLGGAPQRAARDAREALRRGERLMPLPIHEWVPVVAVLWPVEKAQALLEWAGENKLPGDPMPRSDDAIVGRWARKTQQQIWTTIPSLVQHPDTEASSIGRGKARAGRNPWRVAFAWVGPDADPWVEGLNGAA